MLGYIYGQVLFSDGKETLVQSLNGVGYQIHSFQIFPEGELVGLFLSQVVRENSLDLFSFSTLRQKKMFELLTTVKGVGPKSAYAVVGQMGTDTVIQAIEAEDKKALMKIPGVGAKAASQMILDLRKKAQKIMIYSDEALAFKPIQVIDPRQFRQSNQASEGSPEIEGQDLERSETLYIEKNEGKIKKGPSSSGPDMKALLNETLMACEALGFSTDKVVPLAQKILKDHEVKKSEQLVHLVLKEI